VLEPGQRLPVPPSNDELARLARTLNDMLARNDVAFERERSFVADASHELRSPLAILRAELDVALIGNSTPRELRDAVSSAAEEADRLSALAEDLLLLARADRGAVTITSVAIDASDCLQALSDRFSQRAAAVGATIRTSAPAGLEVLADPRRLEQALGNLTENALHHGAGSVLVQARARGDSLVDFHVTDDGPGFPPDFLPLPIGALAHRQRRRPGPLDRPRDRPRARRRGSRGQRSRRRCARVPHAASSHRPTPAAQVGAGRMIAASPLR
jgi:signal transduction histidine kinase